MYWFLIIISLFSLCEGYTDNRIRRFQPNFLFGAASAAYQVEGAWDEDGKGESIWDRWLHANPDKSVDGVNGDIAADSYHNYKQDVEMLRELGVNYYRFSISWPRILPTGLPNKINEKGIEYYSNLTNELVKYNIQPMVTLYHFDLPQQLQELGGWTNPLSVTWFEDYARIVFDNFADKVKYWITVNQPNSICFEGYGDGIMAPGVSLKGIADYICAKNVLLAHAKVYRMYRREYYEKYQGSVGIALAVNWIDPVNNKTANTEAAEIAREFAIGLYMNPIWSPEGDFPAKVKEVVAKKSKLQGFPRSRLPVLSNEEIRLLKKSADFLGFNHYTTTLAKPSKQVFETPSYNDDVGVEFSHRQEWVRSKAEWQRSAPYGIYKAIIHINLKYDYPPFFVTENGWSTGPGLRDTQRVDVMREYMGALLFAIEDGAQALGYTAWSLLDNIEWTQGVSERFGLYEVDFESEAKLRTARLSALVYKHIIKARVANDGWSPTDKKEL